MPLPRARHTRSVPFTIRRREASSGGLLVEGVAYPALRVPEEGPVPTADAASRIDSYRTWMDPATLERLAHDFVRYGRRADSDHDHADIGEIVESFVTREALGDYPADVWVARVLVKDPETAARVESEELTGFSIEVVAGMEKVTLDVEGVGAVKTGRFVDPLPLFLSLVERPAIGIPFASVEEGDPEARSLHARSEPEPRVTHLVRCAHPQTETEEPMPNEHESESTKTEVQPEQAAPAVVEKPSEPDAPVVTREAEATPAARLVARLVSRVLRDGDAPEDQFLRAVAKRFEGTEKRESMDWTDFAAVWAEVGPGIVAWETVWAATMLYENVLFECRYTHDLTPEGLAAMAKAAAAYATVVADLAASAGTTPEARSDTAPPAVAAHARAGKKISAARMEKIKAAREECAKGVAHLDELVSEVEGESEGEGGEGEGEARAALTAAEAQLAELRTKLEVAEARARELEGRTPPRRGGDPEGEPQGEKAPKRGLWSGTIFKPRG